MSSLLSPDAVALLQAEAHRTGRAVLATARRHLRVADRPLVLVPIGLAGEDGALLALGIGTGPADLEVLVCPEPRSWELQAALLRDVARRLCAWLDPLAADRVQVELSSCWTPEAARVAPQVVVPTPAAATLLQRVAERMVWQRRDEGQPPDRTLLRAGGWLWFLGERRELLPQDGLLLVATDAQLVHWTPPISAAEGAHLLALNAALAPPAGTAAVDAARSVEGQAGSALTTPELDATKLQPAIEAFNRARDERPGGPWLVEIQRVAQAVRPTVERIHAACHSALERLRALPPIPPIEEDGRRTVAERIAVVRFADYLADDPRFARADSLRRGLFLVDDAERELSRVGQEARWHDPIVRAVASVTGDALDGEVVSVRETTVQKKRACRRLELVVETAGAWRPILEGSYELVWTEPGLVFEVVGVEVAPSGTSTRVTFVVSAGIKAAFEVLPRALLKGSQVSFVSYAQEFPALRVPSQDPWMLAVAEGGHRA